MVHFSKLYLVLIVTILNTNLQEIGLADWRLP